MNTRMVKVLGVTATVLSLGAIGLSTIGTVSAATIANTVSNGWQAGSHAGHVMPPKLSNVQRTVTNISNGIQITATSTDAATVTKLQTMKPHTAPQGSTTASTITVTRTNISNGVQTTITSTDAAMVTKLQTQAAKGGREGFGFGGEMGGRQPGKGEAGGMFGQNVQRTQTNISNGVQTTITSTDAATVTKLQAMKPRTTPQDSNVIVTQTNISNGIQITMTSTDAATVTKLQTQTAKGGHGGFGFGGGKGGQHGKRGQHGKTPSVNPNSQQ